MPVIGFLSAGAAEAFGSNIRAFGLGLNKSGFVTRERLDSPHIPYSADSVPIAGRSRRTPFALLPLIRWPSVPGPLGVEACHCRRLGRVVERGSRARVQSESGEREVSSIEVRRRHANGEVA
jgi:hypothetical protein